MPHPPEKLSSSSSSSNRKLARRATLSKACYRQQKPGLTAKGDERQFVQHNYTDHANKEDELVGMYGTNLTERYELSHYNMDGNEECSNKKAKPSPLFPLKLYMVLDEAGKKGKGNVITWLPHGRAFYIRNNDLFARQILPEYFKNCKISSFYRQLNLYGFVRLTAGFDTGAYYHEYFLRGKPFLTRNIVRTKVKGTKIRAASSPEDEPDFYSMPPLPILPTDSVEAPTGDHLDTPSVASTENPLGARLADTRVLQETQATPITMPQRISADYDQIQVNHRQYDTQVPRQSTMSSYNNPNSFATMANDHISADPMFDSPNFRGAIHTSPTLADTILSRLTSIAPEPHSYHNPMLPVRSASFTPDHHPYRNPLFPTAHTPFTPTHHLHGDPRLYNMPSSISSYPRFYQDSQYPVNARILGSRDSENLGTMIASRTTEDEERMARAMRALDMPQPHSSLNIDPSITNSTSHLMQNQFRYSRRPRSLNDIADSYLGEQPPPP